MVSEGKTRRQIGSRARVLVRKSFLSPISKLPAVSSIHRARYQWSDVAGFHVRRRGLPINSSNSIQHFVVNFIRRRVRGEDDPADYRLHLILRLLAGNISFRKLFNEMLSRRQRSGKVLIIRLHAAADCIASSRA